MTAQKLGDWKIIKTLGQGSLGRVFFAEHQFTKKQAALKVLPEELSSDRAFITRFEEEVAKIAQLDHPNIVKIHNVSFADGKYFLVSDIVVDEMGETTNLAQYMIARKKRLEEEALIRFLRQIASALDFAHEKQSNLPHGSLKLNNLLLKKGKEGPEMGPEIMITDFGLSKIVGYGAVLSRTYQVVAQSLGVSSFLAKNGALEQEYPVNFEDQEKLTPLHLSFLQNFAFLAPEQKTLKRALNVDGKADVYAFGVLTYYLIMGILPEGIFEMPSKRAQEYKGNWDLVIKSTLQSAPNKRPAKLLTLLDEIYDKVPQAPQEAAVQYQAKLPAVAVVATPASATAANLKPLIQGGEIERPRIDHDPGAIFRIDSSVKHYEPQEKEIKNIEPIQTDMVIIPSIFAFRGSKDGNRDEMPRHQIRLKSFAIDIHPVTNEQFVRFLEVMGGEKDNNHNDIIRLKDSRIKRSAGSISIESGYAKHPVVGVTWYGACAYAKWVGKRLPTEAEWETAARGGIEDAMYPTGDDIEKSEANFFSSDTTAVMSYPPNACGLYDMAGNVYEWCQDWYSYNYYDISVQEPNQPEGPLQGVYRVLRGGCWKSLKDDLRCAKRHRNNPGTVNSTYGFRLAADAQ